MQKLALLTLIFFSALAMSDIVTLRVRPQIVVTPESEVRLSQLIEGSELSKETISHLQRVVISHAPAYGERMELSAASFIESLRAAVSVEKRVTGRQLHLILPKQVRIDTLKRELSVAVANQELQNAWQSLCMDCRLEIEGLSLPKIDKVRDWNIKVRGELPRGSFSLPVELVKEDGPVVNAWVSGRLIVKRKVPVTKKLINLGERLNLEDVTWEYRDTSFALDGIPTSEELVGKRLKQGVRSGDVLWKGRLEREHAISRGELVQVRSSEGPWEVSISVVAQQDAFVGDVLPFKNPKTNSVFMGEVKGLGQVELR